MTTVTIFLRGVPESWGNSSPWSRRAILILSAKKREWADATRLWGRIRRNEAGWEIANPSDGLRKIKIHQYRHGTLDIDNLYSSVKPIVDGCKTVLVRRKKQVQGAGLIWDDQPKWCQIEVTQERVPLKEPCYTIITVERSDA